MTYYDYSFITPTPPFLENKHLFRSHSQANCPQALKRLKAIILDSHNYSNSSTIVPMKKSFSFPLILPSQKEKTVANNTPPFFSCSRMICWYPYSIFFLTLRKWSDGVSYVKKPEGSAAIYEIGAAPLTFSTY